MDVLDLDLHVLAELFVERAERLVHEHDLGLEDERAGKGYALLLAARELVGAARAIAAELHHLERPLDAPAGLRLGHPARLQRKGEVLGDRHMGEQGVVLENDANVALVRRDVVQGLAGEGDLPMCGDLEAGEHHECRRFARARWPEKGEKLALLDIQVQVLDHQSHAVEALLNVGEADDRCGVVRVSYRHSSPQLSRPWYDQFIRRPNRSSRRADFMQYDIAVDHSIPTTHVITNETACKIRSRARRGAPPSNWAAGARADQRPRSNT